MNDWSDAERRVERAQELFEQRQWHEALEELRAATHINPYNGSWFFNIGLILDELGRLEEAIEAYRQAVRIDANDINSLDHLGQDLYRTGRLRDAIRAFEQIEQIDSSFEPSYCTRIIIYSELGDHERAEEMFYTARLYKEHCPYCYYHLACSLEARDLHDKAIYCWTRALDLDGGQDDLHLRIAGALWKKGDVEQARQHFLSDLREHPGRMQSLLSLGELLVQMGRLDEAGEKFRRAIELTPGDPAGFYHHGRWLLRCGRSNEAGDAFGKVLALDPTFPGAHLQLGRLRLKCGQIEAARSHLRAELMLRPDEPLLMTELADLLLDAGETRAAIACLKRLTQAQPQNLGAWQNLAVAQFQRRHFDEGIASCQRALAIDAVSHTALYNLTLAYTQQGRYDLARHWVRQGLARYPKDRSFSDLDLRIRIRRWRAALRNVVRKIARLGRG
jgi:tetratricopeptide (TPR) repeat protein